MTPIYFISKCIDHIKKHGFTSASNASSAVVNSTAINVKSNNNYSLHITMMLLMLDDNNEFHMTCRKAMDDSLVTKSNANVISYFAYMVYIIMLNSQYIHTVTDRISSCGEVISCHINTGQRVFWVILILDGNNNILTIFNNSAIPLKAKVEFIGTVKNHATFRFVKSTTFTKVKILSIRPRPE